MILVGIVVALAACFVTWETAKQLYRAAMDGYILTGRSMSTRVYREKNPTLFRNNVIASIILFPVIAAGAVTVVLDVLHAARVIR